MAESKLVVYKPFGTFTEKDSFDDVKSLSLWPGESSDFPRILGITVYFPSPKPGANGINGLRIEYEAAPGAIPQDSVQGKLEGDKGIVELGPSLHITNIIATVDDEETALYALTFKLSDDNRISSLGVYARELPLKK
ncbi:hypothetical protein DXG01_012036 [Tephrocybe rancida]|nr:hypothetical protein DXG01_012036 [Tephrocybe rancida]